MDQQSALARLIRENHNAYNRWRYQNDDDFRRRALEATTRSRRSLAVREKMKAVAREYERKPARIQYQKQRFVQRYNESLQYRRGLSLRLAMRSKRLVEEGWSWRLHTPVHTPDRVDRHCTACDQDRFLKLWWATKAEPTTYMCNSCFANDFDLMVPEGQHKNLPAVFTSPHLPGPRPNKPS
ncbi:hypothetical protein M436DRAFT_86044 [Aureobasidium namibiae CBS 147.97]|uniref:Uncharacterized protein n=1 Tax=Aureobasidium namibiae CBS 147.97 TaxID=1043004 RepID=A0A074WG82_9PEZI